MAPGWRVQKSSAVSWSDDTPATGQVDPLELGAVEPLAEFGFEEEEAACAWWAAVRDLAEAGSLVDGSCGAAEEVGDGFDVEVRREAHASPPS
jgi:hypothetical protein